jgi:hypothetical protein
MWFRRRWCPVGVRPPWIVDDRYEWLWVYAAVEPLTGDSFFLLLPRVDSPCLQVFADWFGDYVKGERVGMVLDGSGSHGSATVRWPEHVVRLPLPSYSPELNPAELIFRALRAALANRVFDDLAQLEEALCAALRPFWEEPVRLQTLTAYPWWREAAQTITKTSA